MKFLVVVPTIRQELPGFEETMARIRASFTLPTDFPILDGRRARRRPSELASRFSVAYVDMDPLPEILEYPDSAEYLASKDSDVASAMANMGTYMKKATRREGAVGFLKRVAQGIRHCIVGSG